MPAFYAQVLLHTHITVCYPARQSMPFCTAIRQLPALLNGAYMENKFPVRITSRGTGRLSAHRNPGTDSILAVDACFSAATFSSIYFRTYA